MPRGEQIIPPIDVFPYPESQTPSYEFLYQFGYVHDSGDDSTSYEHVIEKPKLESIPAEALDKANVETTPVAWVQFYQRVVVRVRHPERFTGDKPGPWSAFEDGPVDTEILRGECFPAAEPQLLIATGHDGPKFATIAEILEHGQLTPFMKSWLSRYSQDTNSYGSNSFLLELLPILDEEQKRKLLDTKFKYPSIEQTE